MVVKLTSKTNNKILRDRGGSAMKFDRTSWGDHEKQKIVWKSNGKNQFHLIGGNDNKYCYKSNDNDRVKCDRENNPGSSGTFIWNGTRNQWTVNIRNNDNYKWCGPYSDEFRCRYSGKPELLVQASNTEGGNCVGPYNYVGDSARLGQELKDGYRRSGTEWIGSASGVSKIPVVPFHNLNRTTKEMTESLHKGSYISGRIEAKNSYMNKAVDFNNLTMVNRSSANEKMPDPNICSASDGCNSQWTGWYYQTSDGPYLICGKPINNKCKQIGAIRPKAQTRTIPVILDGKTSSVYDSIECEYPNNAVRTDLDLTTMMEDPDMYKPVAEHLGLNYCFKQIDDTFPNAQSSACRKYFMDPTLQKTASNEVQQRVQDYCFYKTNADGTDNYVNMNRDSKCQQLCQTRGDVQGQPLYEQCSLATINPNYCTPDRLLDFENPDKYNGPCQRWYENSNTGKAAIDTIRKEYCTDRYQTLKQQYEDSLTWKPR